MTASEPRYRHLVFDFDHLLFDTDSSEADALATTLRAHGVDNPHDLLDTYQQINRALWHRVELGEITPNEVKSQRFEELADAANLDYDADSVADDYTRGLAAHGALYDGVADMLATLAETHRFSMVTNGIGSVQRGRLQRLGIDDAFDPLIISGEVGVAKPHADIFELVFAAHPDTPRNNFVMIGDSLTSDIQGGTNAGIDTCWYDRHGVGLDPGGGRVVPTHVISRLADLPYVVS
ncbi:MAG: noncanonical pyrimidine nucleotidase, YjjG family [Acidimicrobiales bacterium]|nr:noncanonical pyrimidine nucleotidase, YjjG family [Acidimicrobiales bacterium]